jgi:hypothetical protein
MNVMSSANQSDWLIDFPPPPRSLPFDQEALRTYQCAYYIGFRTEDVFRSRAGALKRSEVRTGKKFNIETLKAGPITGRRTVPN